MGPAALIPAFLSAGSTAMNVSSILDQGEQTYKNSILQAGEMRAQGDAALAESAFEARQQREAGDTAIGDARAAIAGGGGVASDEGSVEVLSEMDERTKFNSMAALFRGRSARKQLYTQAAITEREGKKAFTGAGRKALATVFSGGAKAAGFLAG